MPIGPFGIPGMMLAGGMGLAASGRVGTMSLARYGVGMAAGGMMLGPSDSDTRRGAMAGAAVGAAGYAGYSVYNDYSRIASAYGMGSTAAGTAANAARRVADITERAAAGAGFPIKVGNEARKAMENNLIPMLGGEGVMARGARALSGVTNVGRELGGFTKYGLSKTMKGGAWGAVVGGAALGAYGLLRGGSHVRSNEPMY